MLGFLPVVGTQVIYELAKGFLNPSLRSEVSQNFELLIGLDPQYHQATGDLAKEEIACVVHGEFYGPHLSPSQRTQTVTEVAAMALGCLSNKGRAFIEERERALEEDHPVFGRSILATVETKLSQGAKKPKSYEAVWEHFQPYIPTMVSELITDLNSGADSKTVIEQLNSMPLLRSWIRAQVAFHAIAWMQRAAPAKDRVYDFRHVGNAAYCDDFASGDRSLRMWANKINPDLVVVDTDYILNDRCTALP